jgi:hypothetical protein
VIKVCSSVCKTVFKCVSIRISSVIKIYSDYSVLFVRVRVLGVTASDRKLHHL